MSIDRPALRRLIAGELAQPVAPGVTALSERIRVEHPGALAILFYGAGLWKTDAGALLDFYVLAERYRDVDPRRTHALLGRLLPPNVYYLAHRGVRCKFAVMRLDQFRAAAAGRSPSTQIWARFAQPSRLVYARDAAARESVAAALAEAVITFHRQTLPLLADGDPPARELWLNGLKRTYANEWRSERGERAEHLYAASREALEARSAIVLPGCGPAERIATRGARRWLAKATYFMQLLKAVFTFEGGVDYALWKIERQSGVKLSATDFQRRHPLIAAWPLLWKAWRRGALR